MSTTVARTDTEVAEEPAGPAKGRRRRRARARAAAVVGGVALVGGAGTVAALGFGGGETETAARSGLPPATATVTRTTLVRTETVDGTLGYGDPTVVKARGAGGTLTWLPPEGSTISRGQRVYAVDGDPVVLLYGTTPLYRTLSPGLEGADVAVLESNLSALGYDGFTVDDEYTSATADAVERWQDDLDVPETGSVTVAQAVVAPGRLRVADVQVATGDQATGPVLTTTGTTRVVDVDLDVDKQHLVRRGLAATVELPGGQRVAGTVASVGTVATTKATGNEQTTTVGVSVSVADQKALGTLDEAPVDVVLQAERRPEVLAVPVNALVALAEGGYGLQAVEGSATRYVAVRTGMFAGGRVEVSGSGVREGLVVGVPR